MSYRLTDAAWLVTEPPLSPTDQLVLQAMAYRACNTCGFAWPGIQWLAGKTQLGATAIRAALKRLELRGILRVHAYATGGRGRATEYVVLPAVPGLFAAPCPECKLRRVNPPRPGGIDESGTAKPHGSRGVNRKPTAQRGQNPSLRDSTPQTAMPLWLQEINEKNGPKNDEHQISNQLSDQGALAARRSDSPSARSGISDPPTPEPPQSAPAPRTGPISQT